MQAGKNVLAATIAGAVHQVIMGEVCPPLANIVSKILRLEGPSISGVLLHVGSQPHLKLRAGII